jgi:hypothetical protein
VGAYPSPAIEHLVNAITPPNEGNKVARFKSVLIHVVFDRFHWIVTFEFLTIPKFSAAPAISAAFSVSDSIH